MKKVYLLLIPLVLSLESYAQGEKWSWGIQAEIGFSGQHEKDESNSSSFTSYYQNVSFSEKTPAVGGGLWVQYQVANWLGLRSGLHYINAGEREGSSSSSELISTQQQIGYYWRANTLRVHRLQVPLIAELKIAEGKTKPTVGLGVLWSKNQIHNYVEERYDLASDQTIIQGPIGMPAKVRIGGLQFLANINFHLTDQLIIEIKHVFAKKDWKFSWPVYFEEVDTPEFNRIYYYYGLEYTNRVKTKFHKQTSLVFRYKF